MIVGEREGHSVVDDDVTVFHLYPTILTQPAWLIWDATNATAFSSFTSPKITALSPLTHNTHSFFFSFFYFSPQFLINNNSPLYHMSMDLYYNTFKSVKINLDSLI